jgi:2-keto-3-deoxy-6-phosphogluconate aldolase
LNHQFRYRGIQFLDNDPTQLKNNVIFEITNTSDKEIKRIEGHLSFYDPQGRLVRVFSLATGVVIPPTTNDKALAFSMQFIHNPNSDDTLIRTHRDYRAVWTPTIIEFSDGKVLEDASLKDLEK